MRNAIQSEPGEAGGSSDVGSRVLTPEKLAAMLETSARCADDPMFEEWVLAVEEFRRETNIVPEADA